MRRLFFCAGLALLLAACSSKTPSPGGSSGAAPRPPVSTASTNVTITPILAVTGKIVLVDKKARFVVISLAPGLYPAKDTKLFTYRNESRTGELRVSGPQRDFDTVADIVSGSPQLNDLVNDN